MQRFECSGDCISPSEPGVFAFEISVVTCIATLVGYYFYSCLKSYAECYTILEEDEAGWTSQREIFPGDPKYAEVQESSNADVSTSRRKIEKQHDSYEQSAFANEEYSSVPREEIVVQQPGSNKGF